MAVVGLTGLWVYRVYGSSGPYWAVGVQVTVYGSSGPYWAVGVQVTVYGSSGPYWAVGVPGIWQ